MACKGTYKYVNNQIQTPLVVYFYVFLYDYTLHEAVFVDKINVLCF